MKRKRILIVGIIVVLITVMALGISGCRCQKNLMEGESNSIQTEKKTSAETSSLSSCVIFDEKYCCEKGKIITCDELSEVGFSLPIGTKVYSPFGGILDISYYENNDKEIVVIMWPPKEVMHTLQFKGIIPNASIEKKVMQCRDGGLLEPRSEKIIGITLTEGGLERLFYKVEEGEFIGEVSNIYPSSMLFENKEYNLVIDVYSDRNLPPYSSDSRESQLYVDTDFIKQYFPNVEQ